MPLEPDAIIRLDEVAINEIAALAANADRLPMLLSSSKKIGPKIGTFAISERVAENIDLDLQEVLSVVSGLVNIFNLRQEFSATSEEMAKTIIRSLEKTAKADVIKAWKDGQPKIIEALNALTAEHPLVVSHEAGSEAISMPNTVTSIGMSTGTRPVFSASKDRVLITIISHTLTLEYHEGYRRHRELNLSLDAGDIARLHELCEQAEQAAATLKAILPGPSAAPWEDDGENAD